MKDSRIWRFFSRNSEPIGFALMIILIFAISIGFALLITKRDNERDARYPGECESAGGKVVGPIDDQYSCIVDGVIIKKWYR